MKLWVAPDEWWPVLSVEDHTSIYDDWAEFTSEEIADLLRVEREFNAWQARLAERIGKTPTSFILVHSDVPGAEDNDG